MAKKRDPLTQVSTHRHKYTLHTHSLFVTQVLFRDHLLKTRPNVALVQPFWFACMKELRALLAKRAKESAFLKNLLVGVPLGSGFGFGGCIGFPRGIARSFVMFLFFFGSHK